MRLLHVTAVCSLLTAFAAPLAAVAAAAGTTRSPPAAAAQAAAASKGLDALARKRLVGEHRLTLQWLGFDDLSLAGKVTIRPDGDALSVAGQQLGRGENDGDYVKITGRIVSADQEGFVFVGDILTRVSYVADGAECRRSGSFHFLTKGVRHYWRLQEMDNPCSDVTDYVDIYFLGV